MSVLGEFARSAAMRCEGQTLVLSRRLDAPVPLGLEAGVRLHLVLCRKCSRCARQFKKLHAAMEAIGARERGDEMPIGVRDRLLASIRASE